MPRKLFVLQFGSCSLCSFFALLDDCTIHNIRYLPISTKCTIRNIAPLNLDRNIIIELNA